jgi:hypothetical protein
MAGFTRAYTLTKAGSESCGSARRSVPAASNQQDRRNQALMAVIWQVLALIKKASQDLDNCQKSFLAAKAYGPAAER